MPIQPPPAAPAAATLPDRSDRNNFPTQMYDFWAYLVGAFTTWLGNLASNVQNNATEALGSANAALDSETAAAVSEANAAASAIAAANNATAAPWAAGVYAQYAAAISTINFKTYRKITASSSTATDPANDPTHWRPADGSLMDVPVTGTAQTAASGCRYRLENVAATAVTKPTAFDGCEFAVVPGNGLRTNTVDFGSDTVKGPNGELTGVVTLDLGAPLHVKYFSSISKWVML
jgi:hypothetical protein